MKAIKGIIKPAVLIMLLTALLCLLAGGLQAASGPGTCRFVVYADSRGN